MKKASKPSKKLARRLSAQTGNAAIPRKGKREPIKTRGAEVNKKSKSEKSENDLFPIVGVGASAGGLEALTLPIMAVSDLLAEFEFQQTDLIETGFRALSTPTRAEIVRLDGLHLLVVDDHEDTRELLRVALTNSGADVRTCASSADALATIRSWKPDCIISDVGMPGEDGYELIKKIRSLKKKDRAKIPAIALSGFAGADDKSQAIAAGYQLHLSKPVDLRTLSSEIAGLAQERSKAKPHE